MTLHEDIQAALDRLATELEPEEEEYVPEDEDKSKGQVILDTTEQGGVQVIVQDYDAGIESDDSRGGKGIRATRTSADVIGKTPRPPVEEM